MSGSGSGEGSESGTKTNKNVVVQCAARNVGQGMLRTLFLFNDVKAMEEANAQRIQSKINNFLRILTNYYSLQVNSKIFTYFRW